MLDYPSGSNVTTGIIVREEQKGHRHRGNVTTEKKKDRKRALEDVTLLALKLDDKATSQRMQEASWS